VPGNPNEHGDLKSEKVGVPANEYASVKGLLMNDSYGRPPASHSKNPSWPFYVVNGFAL
jgi:hypothetical protein